MGKNLTDKYPHLFESLVQSPTDFHIEKKFIFPGKGEANCSTLVIAQRGPVFIFPIRLSILGEETDLQSSDIQDVVIEGLNIFRKTFPTKHLLRVGLVNEYIFDTGMADSTKIVAGRFTKVPVPPNGEIMLRVNRPDDDFNRRIEIEAVKKVERMPEIPGQQNIKSYGVKVIVDFNNRNMSQDLEKNVIRNILSEAERYNKEELFTFLNGE
jgi:hypothetical protein